MSTGFLRVLQRIAAIAVVALACGPSVAQQANDLEKPPKLEPLPDIPPPPPGGANIQSAPEPVVTRRQEGDNKIEEYSVHGKVYAIRVTPPVGPPYTMIDPDGNGSFVSSPDDGGTGAGQKVHPPRWVLFEF